MKNSLIYFALLISSCGAPAQTFLGLPMPEGRTYAEAKALSANGQAVVLATESSGQSGEDIWRWKADSGAILVGHRSGDRAIPLDRLDPWEPRIASDGSVVAGSWGGAEGNEAWRWTVESGTVPLGLLSEDTSGGGFTESRALSADGHVITGVSSPGIAIEDGTRFRTWRWSGEMQGLTTLTPNPNSARPVNGPPEGVRALSADGLVLVGSDYGEQGFEAWRWTAGTGTVGLGFLPGGDYSEARAVSTDGSTVIGVGNDADVLWRSWRWTAASGLTEIGPVATLSGHTVTIPDRSGAKFVSADGNVVAGAEYTLDGLQAWRWSTTEGTVWLGFLPGGSYTEVTGMSADGRVVVGFGYSAAGLEVWRWTTAEGLKSLSGDFGLNTTGWEFLEKPVLVSGDGSVLAGSGISESGSRAWIAHIPGAATSAGNSVVVQPVDSSTGQSPASITFDQVTGGGTTTITSSSSGTPPPDGFKLGQPPIYYELSTTAQFSGGVTVCFRYAEGTFKDETKARLFHLENGTWVDVTTSKDPLNNVICGRVVSFSPFALFEENSPPVITGITPPTGPVPVGFAGGVTFKVMFSDPDANDTYIACFSWNDLTSDTLVLADHGSATAAHLYSTSGVYLPAVTVVDNGGGHDSAVFGYVVIYDPNGGFVTGGGWINSPPGAYAANPALAGRANFGFVSKYQKGANVPSGQTQFQFKVANLDFHSTSYEWLVVSGSRAQFKGEGTINGTGNFRFILTAVDGQLPGGGGADRFRIKITDKSTSAIVYDNQEGWDDSATLLDQTVIGGGSITIQQSKN